MAAAILVITILLLVGGFVALAAIVQFWDQVKNDYTASYGKLGVAIARCASALAAIIAKQVATDPNLADTANLAAVLGVVAYLLFESAQCTADYKLSVSLAKVRKDLYDEKLKGEQLQRQIAIRAAITAFIRGLVNGKKERLSGAAGSPPKDRLKRLVSSLDPEQQMHELLALLTLSLRSLHQSPASGDAFSVNFRVALYVPIDGYMAPWMGYDLSNGRYDPFTSYLKHRQRFSVDNNTDPSHTVRCVRDKNTIIIPDTVAAGVQFFTEEQHNYLKSMVAHPIYGIRERDGRTVDGALVVDANQAGYFRESDRQIIEFVLNEFSSRLVLESQLTAFTQPKNG